MSALPFHPAIARWFEEKFGSPTEPQLQGWPAIQSGAHTLIAAPTGSGKTLAAFLCALDALFRDGLVHDLPDETRVLYISPLKALSNDIHKNLELPLAGIREVLRADSGRDIVVRADVRTGDTPAARRQAISRSPPHILVTTPESFYLLLTSASGRRLLRPVRTVIVDEIHAVVAGRRGSHLALSLERLDALAEHPVQRIGLSATQRPVKEVARFLVGHAQAKPPPTCRIVDTGHLRALDLAVELPGSNLEAVMSNEVWEEIYRRLAHLVREHRTTLIFVNTRRLAERVTHRLGELLGEDKVMSHHGSLSAPTRLAAEHRLKRGELSALVATASLELGIDIGSVDLVCQVGTTRSIATLLQRIGRAGHWRGGLPKGRCFPLTRDELVECVATLRCIRQGELDRLVIPARPLDVLAQQIVAAVATDDWDEAALFERFRGAYPYRHLTRADFDAVVQMLAEGYSTKRGRRGALVHHDAIHHRLRGRRGARLTALTSGGAIPDNADYRVVLEPSDTFIGTVNEDFAVESMAGDVFQLGHNSWKIVRIVSGVVRVENAHGQPPGIPFWLGEGPARTTELSRAVGALRDDLATQLEAAADSGPASIEQWLDDELAGRPHDSTGRGGAAPLEAQPRDNGRLSLPPEGARQLIDYFAATRRALGVIPSQQCLVLERFFDESGGMQLVLHAPFGARLNRAWGLALRKRFCRTFNFELQAAATDDAIVLSLGTQHSFPLEEVFHYLKAGGVRDILVQALLDAPMFAIRWRWNATRALALPRFRGGRKIAAPLQRMESENLLTAVFPDQLACLENIVGDRELPDHPLVRQTIDDCLTEAMDIDALEALLRRIESGEVQCVARDVPEPSPMAHEILNAKPYAFLDDAPLEERRTRAAYTRRSTDAAGANESGILDPAAIERVGREAWPQAANLDELHDALLLLGLMTAAEAQRTTPEAGAWLASLAESRRAGRIDIDGPRWIAAERWAMVRAVYSDATVDPPLTPPEPARPRLWEHPEALRELVRGRMEAIGPVTATELVVYFARPRPEIDAALLALEAEGFLLRGKFRPNVAELEWSDRRLLARIHRLTLNRLRAEIEPVSSADFQRFLFAWQRVDPTHRAEGPDGLQAVLDLLDGCELPAAAWEPEVLSARVVDYSPHWLDQLCASGRIGWGRLRPPVRPNPRAAGPVRSTSICVFSRENLPHWLALIDERPTLPDPRASREAPDSPSEEIPERSHETQSVLDALTRSGALFFGELVRQVRLLPSKVEDALAELVSLGWVTSDSFEGLRALLLPSEKRMPFVDSGRARRHKAVTSVEFAGRWTLLREPAPSAIPDDRTTEAGREPDSDHDDHHAIAVEFYARALLRRYGVMFRRLMEREAWPVTWHDLGRVYRRLEARGEIRGGHFISGISGEQFALPEAVGMMRSMRKTTLPGELTVLCGADPLNLVGILTPGRRVPAIAANRILFQDGLPIAAQIGDEVSSLDPTVQLGPALEHQLRVGSLAPALRPYYG